MATAWMIKKGNKYWDEMSWDFTRLTRGTLYSPKKDADPVIEELMHNYEGEFKLVKVEVKEA